MNGTAILYLEILISSCFQKDIVVVVIIHTCMCVCAHVRLCVCAAYVEVGRQVCGGLFFLSIFHGFSGLNSGHPVCETTSTLCTEPFYWPKMFLMNNNERRGGKKNQIKRNTLLLLLLS